MMIHRAAGGVLRTKSPTHASTRTTTRVPCVVFSAISLWSCVSWVLVGEELDENPEEDPDEELEELEELDELDEPEDPDELEAGGVPK